MISNKSQVFNIFHFEFSDTKNYLQLNIWLACQHASYNKNVWKKHTFPRLVACNHPNSFLVNFVWVVGFKNKKNREIMVVKELSNNVVHKANDKELSSNCVVMLTTHYISLLALQPKTH